MKIAIIYRGYYYREDVKKQSNFFDYIDNHKTQFHSFADADLFFETHPTNCELDKKLVNSLNWKAYNFNDSTKNCIESIMNSLKIFPFHGYDFIIITRFDLFFNSSFSDFNVDYDKFNFLWRELKKCDDINGMPRICDHMIGFPTKYLRRFDKIDLNNPDVVKYIERKKMMLPVPEQKGHHLNQFLGLNFESEVNLMIAKDFEILSGNEHKDSRISKYLVLARNRDLMND